jgi:hypothetical protein
VSPNTERSIELDFDRLTAYVDAIWTAVVDTSGPDAATWRELLFTALVRLLEDGQATKHPIRRAGAILVGQLARELERPDLWDIHRSNAHRLDSLSREWAIPA